MEKIYPLCVSVPLWLIPPSLFAGFARHSYVPVAFSCPPLLIAHDTMRLTQEPENGKPMIANTNVHAVHEGSAILERE